MCSKFHLISRYITSGVFTFVSAVFICVLNVPDLCLCCSAFVPVTAILTAQYATV